jgi:hypothetical protein
MNNLLVNSFNDNIIIYDGEFLPDHLKETTTKAILNLFDKCRSIYDQKIFRSKHCIWFIVSNNITEYYIVTSLKNVFAKATNKNTLLNVLRIYPSILRNSTLYHSLYHSYNFNLMFNLVDHLFTTVDNNQDTFDLLE